MILLLVLLPLILAVVAFFIADDRLRPLLLPIAATVHLALTLATIRARGTAAAIGAAGWLELDALGAIALGIVSLLFWICSIYAVGYLRLRAERATRNFTASLLVFLAMTSMMCLAQHLGVLWVALEATTLSTGMLIYFNHNPRSLEAAWKYLMIGSVGIALALLGTFFLAYSARLGHTEASLLFRVLLQPGLEYSRPWLRAALVFLLVGYGTKMGLAPLHTWKPDAYGEAPGLVGALLAGGMTSCAFLALLRVYRVVDIAGEGVFARELFVVLGLLSMAVAAVFMARQRDFKRMLAYSSVEHMGILVLGVGVGGIYGALLHAINNGLTKGILFLAAGNIHRAYGSKHLDQVSGALRLVPLSGGFFLAGFFAITGSPPFGPFISELTILGAAVSNGHLLAAGLFLALLACIFIGMGSTVLQVVQGEPSAAATQTRFREEALLTIPIAISTLLVVLMGVYIPGPLKALLAQAAFDLGGRP